MKDENVFVASLYSCDSSNESATDIVSASNKQSYTIMSKGEGIQYDSATTTVLIDGVSFMRFQLTTKRNNLIQENYITLFTCYRGYAISVLFSYYSKETGAELESMLEHSKFSR